MKYDMRKIIYWSSTFIFLLLMSIGIYININDISTKTFYKDEIYSKTDKMKISEDDKYKGIFTYGPYTELTKGSYCITIQYKSDASENKYDIIYQKDDNIISLAEGYLEKDSEKVSVNISSQEPLYNLEVRTTYNGSGNLEVDKITIKSLSFINNVSIMQIGFVILFGLISLIAWLYLTLYKIDEKIYVKLFDKKPNNNIQNNIIILLGIVFISCLPYFNFGLGMADDMKFHINRIQGIRNGLLQGNFPVKIYPILRGYGYANGIFYPDIFLYIPAILNIIGIDLYLSFKIFIIICSMATYCSMYYSTYKITKTKRTALLASIIYVLAPYRIIDVFSRAAVGEIITFIFLPLVLLGIYNVLWGNYKIKWPLILGMIGVINSHTLSIVIVIIMISLIVILNIKSIFNKNRIITLIKSGIWVILLSCYVWAPMLEQFICDKFVVNYTVNRYLLYAKAIPVSKVLTFISPYIGIHLIIMCLLSIHRYNGDKSNIIENFNYVCSITGFLLVLMATKLFPWNLLQGILGNLQFPWRLFLAATILLSFSSAITLNSLFQSETKINVSLITLIICFFVSYPIIAPKIEGKENVKTVTSDSLGYGEYLPYKTDKNKLIKNKKLYTENDLVELGNYNKNGNEIIFTFKNGGGEYIEVPLLYYKGYSAEIELNGEKKEVPICKGSNNTIKLNIAEYSEGKIRVWYKGTFIQWITFFIQIIVILLLVIGYLYKSKIRDKENLS